MNAARHATALSLAFFLVALFLTACNAPPEISGITPTEAPETGGVVLTVAGRRFTSKTQVTLNGSPLIGAELISDGRLTIEAPPHRPGTVQIGALNPPDRPSADTVPLKYVDSTPPQIIAIEPVGDLPSDAVVSAIRVTFSEPVEHGEIALTDSEGASISGATSVNGLVLAFVPAAPLRAGIRYTATVSSAQDATGNRSETERFLFSISAE